MVINEMEQPNPLSADRGNACCSHTGLTTLEGGKSSTYCCQGSPVLVGRQCTRRPGRRNRWRGCRCHTTPFHRRLRITMNQPHITDKVAARLRERFSFGG